MTTVRRFAPGLLVCAGAGLMAMILRSHVPTVSPLLWAILLGVLVTNVRPLGEQFAPGVAFAGKKVLRTGIVLLGLQLSLGAIAGLGWRMIGVVVAIVTVGILAGALTGRLLGLSTTQTLLVATGFSICGAAAVAAADGVLDAEEEETATAVGLVVLFGTLMIPLVPLLTSLAHLETHDAALFAGGSIHEVAQVVAAAGIIGGGALGTAVLVKLARVVMLAPVMTALSLWARRHGAAAENGTKPPLVPLFVVGFLLMMGVATLHLLPTAVLDPLKQLQTYLLACAMFALGLGVRVAKLVKVGHKPFVLGLVNTLVVGAIAWGGMLLAR